MIVGLAKNAQIPGCSGNKKCTTILGHLTMTDFNGKRIWSKNYGNPSGGIHQFAGLTKGDPAMVINECWGI